MALRGALGIDDPAVLEQLQLAECEIDPNYVIEEALAARLRARVGRWWAPRFKPLGALKVSDRTVARLIADEDVLTFRPFEVIKLSDGYEVRLGDLYALESIVRTEKRVCLKRFASSTPSCR